MGSKKELISKEEYHNTVLLLEQYRMMKFHADLRKKQYEKKASFENIPSAQLEQQLNEIELNDMLLNDIISALNNVKEYPIDGELYYYILYYSYFDSSVLTDDMIANVLNKTKISQDLSRSTIIRKRKKAIEVFGMILWGFLGKESPVFKLFLSYIK